jgi:hypothetical protein
VTTDIAVGFVAGHGSSQALTGTSPGYVNLSQQTSATGRTTTSLIAGYAYVSTNATDYTGSFKSPMYWAAGVALFKIGVQPTPFPSPSPSPSPTPSPSPSPSPTPTPTPSPVPSPSPSASGPCYLSTPIRAAFYYPWYPENWQQGGYYPATWYHPSAGFYSLDGSQGLSLLRSQIAEMQYGRIQAGIASWWGQGTLTDGRIPTLLSAAGGTPFCWTLYYEPAVTAGSTQIASDLAYIAAHYTSNSNYLHVDGKPVLFVYSRAEASCADAQTWVDTNAGRFYLNLQVFGGYTSCAVQPDSWHQYGPAVAEDHQAGYSFSISPGFDKYDESTPRLARDPNRWQKDVADMVASNEPWQLITTFNEWMEGTSVEDAAEWTSASGHGTYLDILHG